MAEFLTKTGLDTLWKKIVAGHKSLQEQIDGNTNLIFGAHATVSIGTNKTFEAGSSGNITLSGSGNVNGSTYATAVYALDSSGTEVTNSRKEGDGNTNISMSITQPVSVEVSDIDTAKKWSKTWTVVVEFLNGAVKKTKTITASPGLYVYYLAGTETAPSAAEFLAGSKTLFGVSSKVTGTFTFNTTSTNGYTWFAIAESQSLNVSAAEVGGLGEYLLTDDGTVEIINTSGFKCTYKLYRCLSEQAAKTNKQIKLS